MTSVSPFSDPVGREKPLPRPAQKLNGKRWPQGPGKRLEHKASGSGSDRAGIGCPGWEEGSLETGLPLPSQLAPTPEAAGPRATDAPITKSHTHTTTQTGARHARTRGRKAVEDRRCRHLLRNAECTLGHTPNTPPQPATHFIQAAADMPHTSKHHRGTHTHGNHDKTHTQAPPRGLAHTGSSSNLLDSQDPTPGTARKSLVSGTATISIQHRHWKCPPPT